MLILSKKLIPAAASILFFTLGVHFESDVKDVIYSSSSTFQRLTNSDYSLYSQARKSFLIAKEKYLKGDSSSILDLERSIALFKVSHENGINGAAYNLALIYTGVSDLFEKDTDRCKLWMQRSERAGNPNANICLCAGDR